MLDSILADDMIHYAFIFDEDQTFHDRCLAVFKYQAKTSPVYRSFLQSFGLNEESEPSLNEIPLLPIEAFKHSSMITDHREAPLIFKSSGTGEMSRSTHYVPEPEVYRKSIQLEFSRHFSSKHYSLFCYLPGYSENRYSSLVWMADYLMSLDKSGLSKYIPNQSDKLQEHIAQIKNENKKILLFGASFGLLDLAEQNEIQFPDTLEIIETGGMKTYRREMSKRELRKRLSEGFNIPLEQIHSEYGMCELLSQMYAIGSPWFSMPHWVRVTIRKDENPGEICEPGEEGKIGIIDLANIYSCSFILTGDRGVMDEKGKFQVLGRWNANDMRGCNFMIDQ